MDAKNVRSLRRKLKLTQEALGRLIGVTGNTVARWERGEVRIRPTIARLIELITASELKKQRRRKGNKP